MPTKTHSDYSPESYVVLGALSRASAVGGPLYGLPERPDAMEVIETDRPASRLTAPNATNESVRLAQYIRISGLRGVACLALHETSENRRISAQGRGTRNVPMHSAGMPPGERLPVAQMSEDEALPESEMRQLRRYRTSMKGVKFTLSMAKEAKARDRGFWRAALPYWPLDKAGRFESGKVRINPRTQKETFRFLDGTYLDERIETFTRLELVPDVEAKRARVESQQAELSALMAAQAREAKYDRKGRLLVN